MENSELLRRISARPDVFGGKPIIRNMRLSEICPTELQLE